MDVKQRILLKASDLFNRYGIRSVSMDDIAAQLGMSKKTLYQYYTDKDGLVDDVFTSIMEDNKDNCCHAQQKADNALHEIYLAFEKVMKMFGEMNPSVLFDMEKYHPKSYKKFKDFQNGFLYKMLTDNLKRGIEEGLYRERIDIDVLSRYRIQSIMMPFDSEIFPNNRTQLVHIEQVLIEHFLWGIATSKGQKLIQKYFSQRINIKG
ncbi:MAG TPA: TetR/AcrR family transcriptional regulator [Chitinophagaceae bacterium]